MSEANLNQAALLVWGNVEKQQGMAFGRASALIPRFRTTAQTLDYVFAAVMEEVNNVLDNIESRPSPSEKDHTAVDDQWEMLVHGFDPKLPLNNLWNEETVRKYYKYMLPFLAINSKDTKGRAHVKSSTLESFKELFARSIAKHAQDTEGNQCGSFLLSKGGNLSGKNLMTRFYTLITKYKLD